MLNLHQVKDEICDIGRRLYNRGFGHASSPIDEMLRKNLAYTDCPLYRKIIDDIKAFVMGV